MRAETVLREIAKPPFEDPQGA